MKDDLFFVKKAKSVNINKIKLHPEIKNDWNRLCKAATTNPNQYEKKVQILLDIVNFKKGIKVLDVGCGAGQVIIEMAYLGANCTGLDAAKDKIRLINQVRDDYKLNVTGVWDDACNLPFDDETFDVVMSYEFFEHVTDIDLTMKEQIRVLRSGGRLVIEQANFLNPFTLLDLLIKYPLRTHGKYGGGKMAFFYQG